MEDLDFVRKIRDQQRCKRNLIVLSGDTGGLYPVDSEYRTLEPALSKTLGTDFSVVTYDLNGIDFPDDESLQNIAANSPLGGKPVTNDRSFLGRFVNLGKPPTGNPEERTHSVVAKMVERVVSVDFQPLHCLHLVREITREIDTHTGKPLCIIMRDSSIIFPRKADGDLTSEQAQRLQLFLNWMRSDAFTKSQHLVLLLTSAAADLKETILQLPSCGQVEIPLPTADKRKQFARHFMDRHPDHEWGLSIKEIVADTPGLQLSALSDVFETSVALDKPLDRSVLKTAVNEQLVRLLGDFGTIEHFPFGPEDVIGDGSLKGVVEEVYADCDDPDLCPHMILYVGPNGGGKTFVAKAYLKASGRIIIVLSKIRDSLYGGTERLFERFRMVVEAFGNIAVFVDEADTFFGRLDSTQSHEVDNRLTGSIQDMTSDARFRYKVLWVLATARPDNLAPDILSRCASTTIPVFDLDGTERKQYLKELLIRKDIGSLTDEELEELHTKTEGFSNRDLDHLVMQIRSRRRKDPSITATDVLSKRRPGLATIEARFLQEIEAARVSSFPDLIPERIHEAMQPNPNTASS